MREYGIPKLLTWRWTPFAALVLGSLSFVGFALLVIPDRIGHLEAEGTADSLSARFMRSPGTASPTPAGDWSKDNAESGAAAPSPMTRVASRNAEMFPKRGFSPPLERNEPPSPPPSPPPVMAIPPPAPPAESPPPSPPPPEVLPQPVPAPDAPAPPPPDAAVAPPPPSSN